MFLEQGGKEDNIAGQGSFRKLVGVLDAEGESFSN